jgi:starvation-inducible DNA-binding protein
MPIDIGIAEPDRAAIADGLARLLADTYTLYLKTHNFHWNVEGPLFATLHTMFEQQYTELAPGSYSAYAALASVKEASGEPSAEAMVRELARDQETVARTARAAFASVEKAGDQPSADLLTQRLLVHEKTAWMLRAMAAR